MRYNGDIYINLKAMGVTFLTLYMLTASLYIAIFNSLSIQMAILSIILVLLLSNEIRKGFLYINKTDILFILACFAALGSLHSSTFTTGEIAGPVIFSLGVLISLFIRGDIENYKYSIKLIKWGGIIYALSVMFSYFFSNLYNSIFLSNLRPIIAERILQSMNQGYYPGFTSDVAFTAGYIVSAIGVIICGWIVKESPSKGILLFIILFLGLLLTQKRAHLLFMILSCLFVYLQYSSFIHEKVKKIFKIIFSTIFIVVPILLLAIITEIGQTLFLRIFETFQNFSAGQDITSNRSAIWKHAWDLFSQNPFYGIGWGNFRETVVGTITVHTEMTTHNIYLQLLSETGIIGTVFILLPFIITFLYTIKITRLVSSNRIQYSYSWKFAILFSLYSQTFFLLYGLTGNPLYDYSFFIVYILSFGIIYSFRIYKYKKTFDSKIEIDRNIFTNM